MLRHRATWLEIDDGEGHALAYVHRHVLDATKPAPVVPIFLNTYFPPNQPRPKRCYQLGQAVRQAVEKFPEDARVGILASGGLSHFLVDEEFDRAILKAIADKALYVDKRRRHAAKQRLTDPKGQPKPDTEPDSDDDPEG